MKSQDHTYNMLAWFSENGITKLDFSVKRPNGTFLQRDTAGIEIADEGQINRILKWLGFENWKRESDIYVRPARYHDWPILFLDDLSPHNADLIAKLHTSMLIHTSKAGGYHAWISTTKPLGEDDKGAVQHHYAQTFSSDIRSTSGEHWGRLAGFKNHKRGGTDWVNFHATGNGTAIDPNPVLFSGEDTTTASFVPRHRPAVNLSQQGIDESESGKEYGWAIGFIRATGDIEEAKQQLHERASARGKSGNINRYVDHTINKAAMIAVQN